MVLFAEGCVRSSTPSDPFGYPPKGASPNCGPEERYNFNTTINSKEDFVSFIRNTRISQWVRLDNFEGESAQKDVMWDKVLNSVNTEKIGKRTIYSLDYTPIACGSFTLKMTNDGYVSLYGCCGI